MNDWDPNNYLRFEDQRTRPSVDLVSRISLSDPKTVIDLGCGPGNSTQVLRARWPYARVTGLDSSPGMVSAARESHPGQEWVLGDIGGWSSAEAMDVVFSNAALQWVPGHNRLVPHLFEQVAPDGVLAFQIPARMYSSIRGLIHEIADDPAWSSRMEAARTALTIEEPNVYYDLLAPLARSIDMWETIYYHVMDTPAAIVEWISSTGLRPFLEALDTDEERESFVAMLVDRVSAAYTVRADGRLLFPFRRICVIAYK